MNGILSKHRDDTKNTDDRNKEYSGDVSLTSKNNSATQKEVKFKNSGERRTIKSRLNGLNGSKNDIKKEEEHPSSSVEDKRRAGNNGSVIRSKCHSIINSIRPRSLMTSLIPVLLGAILAMKVTGQFSWIILLSTILTAISVHAAGNLVNTYCDYMKGIDSNPASDDRTLVDHLLTPEEVANLGVVFYLVGCFGFVMAAYYSPARIEILALIYFGGISSSFLYTGGIGLKYIALGDLIIMLTFGPVSVLYSYVAQTGE